MTRAQFPAAEIYLHCVPSTEVCSLYTVIRRGMERACTTHPHVCGAALPPLASWRPEVSYEDRCRQIRRRLLRCTQNFDGRTCRKPIAAPDGIAGILWPRTALRQPRRPHSDGSPVGIAGGWAARSQSLGDGIGHSANIFGKPKLVHASDRSFSKSVVV